MLPVMPPYWQEQVSSLVANLVIWCSLFHKRGEKERTHFTTEHTLHTIFPFYRHIYKPLGQKACPIYFLCWLSSQAEFSARPARVPVRLLRLTQVCITTLFKVSCTTSKVNLEMKSFEFEGESAPWKRTGYNACINGDVISLKRIPSEGQHTVSI